MGSQPNYPNDIIRLECPCEVGSQMWISQMIDLVRTLQAGGRGTEEEACRREAFLHMDVQDLKKELAACRDEMARMQRRISSLEERKNVAIAAFNEALAQLKE